MRYASNIHQYRQQCEIDQISQAMCDHVAHGRTHETSAALKRQPSISEERQHSGRNIQQRHRDLGRDTFVSQKEIKQIPYRVTYQSNERVTK